MRYLIIHQMKLIGVFLILGACSKSPASVSLESYLTILGPNYDYSYKKMRDDWVLEGEIEQILPHPVVENKKIYISISGGENSLIALRPIKAQLLATPFLFWEWRVIDTFENDAPLKLTIGFLDVVEQSRNWSIKRLLGAATPDFSRSLSIEWSRDAMQKGSLRVHNNGQRKRPLARYIARGGKKNQNIWWREALDLSSLHAKAWPNMDMRNTEIVFVGFIVDKIPSGMLGHLRGIRLSR